MLRRDQFFPYQQQAYDFGWDTPFCAWWIDMGLGKTAPALTLAADLLADWAVTKVLVIAPKRVATDTWPKEVQNWEHLRHLRVSTCVGGIAGVKAGLSKDADIYTVNVEMLDWLVDHYKKKWPFDFIIVDESSKFKSHDAKRFKALKRLAKHGLYCRMLQLTGTPAPNGLTDVWAPAYLLDNGKALGRTITDYRNMYFLKDFMGYKWELREGAEDKIYKRLAPMTLVIKGANTEPPVYNNVVLTMPRDVIDQYKQFQKDMIIELTGGDELMAVNAAVLQMKLQQFASGEVYLPSEDNIKPTAKLHTLKLEALQSVIEEANGTPILVGYAYQHEKAALLKKYPKAVTMDDGDDVIDRWNRGEIAMLIGHPASMGHGLNLQHGSHIAVWYGLTWSLELYQQFNKRLDRTGQKRRVIIHHLVCEGTVDKIILEVMQNKDATQTALTDAVLKLGRELLAA